MVSHIGKQNNRLIQTKTCYSFPETAEHYLIYFNVDGTYTVAERKFLLCEDCDIKVGEQVKVKVGPGKSCIGHILNIGELQENIVYHIN